MPTYYAPTAIGYPPAGDQVGSTLIRGDRTSGWEVVDVVYPPTGDRVGTTVALGSRVGREVVHIEYPPTGDRVGTTLVRGDRTAVLAIVLAGCPDLYGARPWPVPVDVVRS